MHRTFRLLCLLLCLLVAPVWAQTKVTFDKKDITKWGAHARTYTPIAFVDEDRMLVGMDSPPFNIKAKGIVSRIWLVRFDSNWKVESVKNWDLKLGAKLEQTRLTPDNKGLVLVTKKGAQTDLLNLADGKVTNIFSHVKGQNGFRLDPSMCFSCGSNFYALGYPYDGENFVGNTTIALVDLKKSGIAAFSPTIDLLKVQNGVANTTIRSYHSPDVLFFVHKLGDDSVALTRWTPAGGYQEVDRGRRHLGSWGEQEFIVHAMTRADGSHDLTWFNGKTGDKKVLFASPKRILNPVVGHEGNTWVALEEDSGGFVNVVAGSDREPTSRKLLSHVVLGVLRVGSQGETVVYQGVTGSLTVFKMP